MAGYSPQKLSDLNLDYLLNRRFTGLWDVRTTAVRAIPGAIFSAVAAAVVMEFLPVSGVLAAGIALIIGGLVTLPFIWREVQLLMRL